MEVLVVVLLERDDVEPIAGLQRAAHGVELLAERLDLRLVVDGHRLARRRRRLRVGLDLDAVPRFESLDLSTGSAWSIRLKLAACALQASHVVSPLQA